MTTVLLAQWGRSTWICNLNIIYFHAVKHTRWEVQRLPSDLFPDSFSHYCESLHHNLSWLTPPMGHCVNGHGYAHKNTGGLLWFYTYSVHSKWMCLQTLHPSIGQVFLSSPVSFSFEPLYLLVLDTPLVMALIYPGNLSTHCILSSICLVSCRAEINSNNNVLGHKSSISSQFR